MADEAEETGVQPVTDVVTDQAVVSDQAVVGNAPEPAPEPEPEPEPEATMRITMLVSMGSTDFMVESGDVVDWAQSDAIRLIEAGYAVPFVDAPVERTVKKAPAERR